MPPVVAYSRSRFVSGIVLSSSCIMVVKDSEGKGLPNPASNGHSGS